MTAPVKFSQAELLPESSAGGTVRSIADVNQNYPILWNVYKDPDNQFEKVVLAVLLPSGAKNVRLALSRDGMVAFENYAWPKTMFTMED